MCDLHEEGKQILRREQKDSCESMKKQVRFLVRVKYYIKFHLSIILFKDCSQS